MKRGDTHNFGKHVKNSGSKWLMKPRETFWEKLFLSKSSDFRAHLEEVLVDEPLMDYLPTLSFRDRLDHKHCTLVEKIVLKQVPIKQLEVDTEFLLEALGGLFAIMSWFGIGDLHKENIFFGKHASTDKIILTPVDIEFIFKKIYLPTDLGLLPHADPKLKDISGIKPLEWFIKNSTLKSKLAVIYAYLRVSHRLIKHSNSVTSTLKHTPGIMNAVIRSAPRHTMDYISFMKSGVSAKLIENKFAFIEEELVQIARGDVPYFFRTLKDSSIKFYSSSDLKKVSLVKNKLWIKSMTAGILQLDEIFHDKLRRQTLLEYGPLILAAYFIPADFIGKLRYRNMSLEVSARMIKIHYRNETNLKGPRSWPELSSPL